MTEDPQELESPAAISPQNVVVVAGAGTGKTRALVNDYLFTLLGLDGTGKVRSPHRVLAITFTDKAAAEMRRRVVLSLAQLVREPTGDDEVMRRAAEVGASLPTPEVLKRLQSQLAGAPMQTFHALAASLLRDHALHAGIDPGFDQLDDVEERQLLSETAEAVVLDRLAQGDRAVAELTARFSLRRLGGGGGLCGGLCRLYGALAERGVTPSALQPACTVDDAAARVGQLRVQLYQEMKELLRQLEDPGVDRYAKERGATLGEAFTSLREALDRKTDETAEIAVAAAWARVRRHDGGWGKKGLADQRLAAFTALHDLGAALCDQAAAAHGPAVRGLLVDLDDRVSAEKDARGVLGFGDLLVRTRDLLRDTPSLRARVKARFDRILVDEYQDTSPVQEDLVALLAEEVTRGDRVRSDERAMDVLRLGRGRLFVVGDPKQSIYGFRGADAKLFGHTLDVVTEGSTACGPTGERRSLTRSWRSRAPVVELINTIAEATLGKNADALFDAGDRLLAERPGEGPAGALLRATPGGNLDLDDAEPWVLARKVRELIDDALPVGKEKKPCRPKDITVLVRRISAAAPIGRALAHVGIPAQITGGEGFFARPEVMDLIAALRLLVDPADELAGVTVLRSPLVGLTDDELVRLHQAGGDSRAALSWPSALKNLEAADLEHGSRDQLLILQTLFENLRTRVTRARLPEILDALVEGTDFVLPLGVEPDAEDRLANVEKLRVLCEGRAGEAVATIGRLWEFLDAPPREGVASSVGPEVDAVRIMTVHQAKGLEFPVVFIADLGTALPGQWGELVWDPALGLAVSHRGRPIASCEPPWSHPQQPVIKQIWNAREAREQAELMRLLYVALTRACDWVYLVGEERSSGKASLRRLVEDARRAQRRTMDLLLPVERYPGEAPPARHLPPSLEAPPQRLRTPPTLGPPPKGPIRVGPSALTGADEDLHHVENDGRHRNEGAENSENAEKFENAEHAENAGAREANGARSVAESEAKEQRRRQGRLVHAVLAQAGQEADAGLLSDAAQTRWLIKACLRSAGEDPQSTRFGELVERCASTLSGPIADLLRQGFQLSFEEALRFEVLVDERRVVVVGTADLIARSEQETWVIDFKSSAQAAASEATQLQLAGYAAALADRGEEAISVAACVVGQATATLEPRLFDATMKALLLERVAVLAASVEHIGGGHETVMGI